MASIDAQLGPTEPEETRTLAQRRFDLLSDLVCGRANPAEHWQALVVLSFETLTGASDTPGEIPGMGPISAAEARELAANATLRRAVVNVGGELISIDTTVHRPPAPKAAGAAAIPKPEAAPCPAPVVAERLMTRQVEPAEFDEDLLAPECLDTDEGLLDLLETDRVWLAAQRGLTEPGFERAQCAVEETFLHRWCPLHEALLDVLDRSRSTPLPPAVRCQVYEPYANLLVEVERDAGPDPDVHRWQRPPRPRTPASPTNRPGPPETAPPPTAPPVPLQLSSDIPPKAGDLAWAEDTIDWDALIAGTPRSRYVREPGPDPTLV